MKEKTYHGSWYVACMLLRLSYIYPWIKCESVVMIILYPWIMYKSDCCLFSQVKNKPWLPRVYSWILHRREHLVFTELSDIPSDAHTMMLPSWAHTSRSKRCPLISENILILWCWATRQNKTQTRMPRQIPIRIWKGYWVWNRGLGGRGGTCCH
jgi:hypothetical protein